LEQRLGFIMMFIFSRISGMYRPLVLVLTQPSTRLFFNCFDIPQIAGSAFYAPVLRSWLVASTLINFQQISECKLTQLYSLPDTGKKADKKRYLFTWPRRKWTCSDENMLYPFLRWSVNPRGLRGSIKTPAKTSVVHLYANSESSVKLN